MITSDKYARFPELREFIDDLKTQLEEIKNCQRPPEQTILDDVDLRQMLKCSKRTTAKYRALGMIDHHKVDGKIYYKLSDILAFIDLHKIPSVNSQLKIK